jgi:hypothetical protein
MERPKENANGGVRHRRRRLAEREEPDAASALERDSLDGARRRRARIGGGDGGVENV